MLRRDRKLRTKVIKEETVKGEKDKKKTNRVSLRAMKRDRKERLCSKQYSSEDYGRFVSNNGIHIIK